MGKPLLGARLADRYQIRAITADRPTGMLYRAFDEQIGVEVALRVIDEELLVGDAERKAFVAQAARAKTLQHPNLIRMYDVVLDGESVFLVMQWAPGERLSRRLTQGPLPIAEARAVLRRAAAGIAHAHQHGVVLGNVRADTVILYPDGLKLTNVGIGTSLPRARFLAAMDRRGEGASLAPEIIAGKPGDERSDLYALALLARELLTSAGDPGQTEPDAPTVPRPREATFPVIERALSADPALRPRDAELFVRELEAALDGKNGSGKTQISAPPVPTGRDTERYEKLDPSQLPALPDGGTRPDARGPAAELELESGPKDGATNPRKHGAPGVELELDVEELVEVPVGNAAGEGHTLPIPRLLPPVSFVPDVTDVGHRSPLREEDSADQKAMPSPEQLTQAPIPTPTPSPIPTPTPSPTPTPTAELEPEPITDPIPSLSPRPAPSPAPAPDFAPAPEPDYDDNENTQRVARFSIDAGQSGAGGEPAPTVAARLSPMSGAVVDSGISRAERPGRALVLLIVLGMSLGVLGAGMIWRFASPPGSAPIAITTSAPTPVPTMPVATPVITPVTSPIAPASPPPVSTGPCPLGMAPLSSPHPFCIDQYEYPGGHTIPRTQVSVSDAAQVCRSRGLRLCADAEWEQACRGNNNASFPYGGHYDPARCHNGGTAVPGAIIPAGSMPRCRSAAGAYDMSGNVAEWSASGSQRGGSAFSATQTQRCSHIVRNPNPAGASDVGFRCCGDQR